jgi:hypothetical protein
MLLPDTNILCGKGGGLTFLRDSWNIRHLSPFRNCMGRPWRTFIQSVRPSVYTYKTTRKPDEKLSWKSVPEILQNMPNSFSFSVSNAVSIIALHGYLYICLLAYLDGDGTGEEFAKRESHVLRPGPRGGG